MCMAFAAWDAYSEQLKEEPRTSKAERIQAISGEAIWYR